MAGELNLGKIPMRRKWRSVCASGQVHAEFSIGDPTRPSGRIRQVCDYDDRHGCGPHTAQQSDDGEHWTEAI